MVLRYNTYYIDSRPLIRSELDVTGDTGPNVQLLDLIAIELEDRGRQAIEQVIEEHSAEGSFFARMILEHRVVRQVLLKAHGIDGAKPVAPRMIGQHSVPDDVGQHPLGPIGRDIDEPVVEVLLVLVAKLLKMVEEVAGEQADSDSEFQDIDIRLQASPLPCGGEGLGVTGFSKSLSGK